MATPTTVAWRPHWGARAVPPRRGAGRGGKRGFRYWPADLAGLPPVVRQVQRLMHRYMLDGGPVKIADIVNEDDEVAGFPRGPPPGHAPGLIGLWRESDRLALVSDCFYTLDIWGRSCPASMPPEIYNYDTLKARESIRKLAEMEPAAAWPGHGKRSRATYAASY